MRDETSPSLYDSNDSREENDVTKVDWIFLKRTLMNGSAACKCNLRMFRQTFEPNDDDDDESELLRTTVVGFVLRKSLIILEF